MKSIQELYEEVLKSKDLQKEFVACKKEEDLISLMKKDGCEATIDEVKKFIEEKFVKEGKVNDKEIERLSGGCAAGSDICLSSFTLLVGCLIKGVCSATIEGKEIGYNTGWEESLYCHDK